MNLSGRELMVIMSAVGYILGAPWDTAKPPIDRKLSDGIFDKAASLRDRLFEFPPEQRPRSDVARMLDRTIDADFSEAELSLIRQFITAALNEYRTPFSIQPFLAAYVARDDLVRFLERLNS
jgi:hypothetical protein